MILNNGMQFQFHKSLKSANTSSNDSIYVCVPGLNMTHSDSGLHALSSEAHYSNFTSGGTGDMCSCNSNSRKFDNRSND